ncbi:11262_t:CDS:2, partial [Racocetra fulgida]
EDNETEYLHDYITLNNLEDYEKYLQDNDNDLTNSENNTKQNTQEYKLFESQSQSFKRFNEKYGSSPPKKQRLHEDKRIESYMNIDNCNESDQEDQEPNSDIETDNDDIIESRLTPPLPLNEEELSNKELLSNNKGSEELNYELQGISSEFEAAVWLAKHPRVLELAFEMYNAMLQTLENSQESSPKLKFSLKLEAKALFLRTKNNTPALYTKLASAVCGISKVNKQILALIKKVGSCFDDYHYRLLAKLRKRADECLNQFGNIAPTNAQLLDFISENIWCEILSQFLEATEQPALRHNKRIWNALGNFVREAIKKIIISKIEETDMKVALRSCDAITVNLPIPTVLGVVTRLLVQDLLKCKT